MGDIAEAGARMVQARTGDMNEIVAHEVLIAQARTGGMNELFVHTRTVTESDEQSASRAISFSSRLR
eukprot:3326329-Lingulodinium_polyedra.AAC.1